MKLQISYGLYCEVDTSKDDCRREPPHCHIVKNGRRVAQVWLDSVSFSSSPGLGHSVENEILSFVASHKYELKNEYEYNKNHGTD